MNIEIPADYVVLSVGTESPNRLDHLCETLGISRTADGFVQEVHLKFQPVDSANPGVYTASSFPKDVGDSINLGKAAASSAAIHLTKGEVELELIKAIVDEDLCVGCGLCDPSCPYLAITMEKKGDKEISVTDDVKCQGCGTCVACCPIGARELRWWRDEAFLQQIEAIISSNPGD
jgi:heterodisulfide reductase subunit A